MEECASVIYIKNRGERIYMNERNIDIEDMQCWVFRMAQTRWKMPAKNVQNCLKNMIFGNLSKSVMIFCI